MDLSEFGKLVVYSTRACGLRLPSCKSLPGKNVSSGFREPTPEGATDVSPTTWFAQSRP